MIVFHYVEYKNFLASGNTPIRIQLDKSASTLISGKNGAGKSTMLEAITFALFNKPYRRINKPELVNSVNGSNALVTIEFTARGKLYRVVRGIKPSVFEIYEDDVLINQESDNRDYQKHLEQQILKFSHKSFVQVVILSAKNFISFMSLPAGQRRLVIEDLLDINIFSTMNSVLKQRYAVLKADMENTANDIEIVKTEIKHKTNHIDYIKSTSTTELENKKTQQKTILDTIANRESRLKTVDSKIIVIGEKLQHQNTIEKKQRTIQQDLIKCSHDKELLESDISDIMGQDVCPTCTQYITHETKTDLIDVKQNKIELINDRLADLSAGKAKVSELMTKLNVVREKYNECYTERSVLTNEIANLKTQATSIEKEIDKLETASTTNIVGITDELTMLNNRYEELNNKRLDLIELSEYYNMCGGLLKDDGIKASIIKKYLPLINKTINEYLEKFDFYVSFTLDEEFNEKILARYRETHTYNSFSAGEQQRIDLAMLFAWREVAKQKNSLSTNLLFMDEIFDSSLDADSIEPLVDILSSMRDTNIFVISHKNADVLYDRFRSHIQVGRDKHGFSVLK